MFSFVKHANSHLPFAKASYDQGCHYAIVSEVRPSGIRLSGMRKEAMGLSIAISSASVVV